MATLTSLTCTILTKVVMMFHQAQMTTTIGLHYCVIIMGRTPSGSKPKTCQSFLRNHKNDGSKGGVLLQHHLASDVEWHQIVVGHLKDEADDWFNYYDNILGFLN